LPQREYTLVYLKARLQQLDEILLGVVEVEAYLGFQVEVEEGGIRVAEVGEEHPEVVVVEGVLEHLVAEEAEVY